MDEVKNKHCIYIWDEKWDVLLDQALFEIGEYGWAKEMTIADFLEKQDEVAKIEGGLTVFIRQSVYDEYKEQQPSVILDKAIKEVGNTYMIEYK